jgi:hypothetical protein
MAGHGREAAIYRVTLRGVEQRALSTKDGERQRFLDG